MDKVKAELRDKSLKELLADAAGVNSHDATVEDTLYKQTIEAYTSIMEANRHYRQFLVKLKSVMEQTPKEQRLIPFNELTSLNLGEITMGLLGLATQMEAMRRVAFPSVAQYREFLKQGKTFSLFDE